MVLKTYLSFLPRLIAFGLVSAKAAAALTVPVTNGLALWLDARDQSAARANAGLCAAEQLSGLDTATLYQCCNQGVQQHTAAPSASAA